eukprot:GHVT01013784.1.p1 GENE.GHVT01013784.1~~GHVT01013784.1.p1  ORF type:complete len:221 (-),score=29.68 GHVT01013784.1:650-1312(-)
MQCPRVRWPACPRGQGPRAKEGLTAVDICGTLRFEIPLTLFSDSRRKIFMKKLNANVIHDILQSFERVGNVIWNCYGKRLFHIQYELHRVQAVPRPILEVLEDVQSARQLQTGASRAIPPRHLYHALLHSLQIPNTSQQKSWPHRQTAKQKTNTRTPAGRFLHLFVKMNGRNATTTTTTTSGSTANITSSSGTGRSGALRQMMCWFSRFAFSGRCGKCSP